MVVTVQQLYDYAFKNCLLHENVNCVLKYYKNSVPEERNKIEDTVNNINNSILSSGTDKNSTNKFDYLIEFTFEDVIELFNSKPK